MQQPWKRSMENAFVRAMLMAVVPAGHLNFQMAQMMARSMMAALPEPVRRRCLLT